MLLTKKIPTVGVMLISLMACDDANPAGSVEALRADIAACIPGAVTTIAEANRMEECLDEIPSASVAPEEVFDVCFTSYSTCADTNGEPLCSPILDECFDTVRALRDEPERNVNACLAASDGCIAGGIATSRCLDGLEGCLDTLDGPVPDLYENAVTELCLDVHTECVTETSDMLRCDRVRDACLDYVEQDDDGSID